ncbi:MAG: response regulator [bacterium]|nr:response regulator [bacterium]MDT8395601.1 response regulator [bacterium]
MKWVLIVEPSEFDFNYLNRVITRLGYRTFRASSAEESIHLLGESLPDAIICGDKLPDKDPLDLCRALKEDPMTTRTPVLMASSNTDFIFQHRALKAGFAEIINRPMSIQDFFLKLEKCLSDRGRVVIRAPMSVPVTVDYQDRKFPYTTHTFGEGGLFLPSPDSMFRRTLLGLEFCLPGINNLFDLKGEVVYTLEKSTEDCPPGMGIKFVDIAQALKKLLKVYMQNYLTKAAVPS